MIVQKMSLGQLKELQSSEKIRWAVRDKKLPDEFQGQECNISWVRPFMAGGYLIKTIDEKHMIRLGGNGNQEYPNIHNITVEIIGKEE
jgi:hypothetical protein